MAVTAVAHRRPFRPFAPRATDHPDNRRRCVGQKKGTPVGVQRRGVTGISFDATPHAAPGRRAGLVKRRLPVAFALRIVVVVVVVVVLVVVLLVFRCTIG